MLLTAISWSKNQNYYKQVLNKLIILAVSFDNSITTNALQAQANSRWIKYFVLIKHIGYSSLWNYQHSKWLCLISKNKINHRFLIAASTDVLLRSGGNFSHDRFSGKISRLYQILAKCGPESMLIPGPDCSLNGFAPT